MLSFKYTQMKSADYSQILAPNIHGQVNSKLRVSNIVSMTERIALTMSKQMSSSCHLLPSPLIEIISKF